MPAGTKPVPQPPCTRAQPRRRCGTRLSDISDAVRDLEDGARSWLAIKDVLLVQRSLGGATQVSARISYVLQLPKSHAGT
jgi:hypothetical protein